MKFLKLTLWNNNNSVLVNMANVTEVYSMDETTEIWLTTTEGEYNTPCRVRVKESLDEIHARLDFYR